MERLLELFDKIISGMTMKKAVFSRPLDKSVVRATAKITKNSNDYVICVEKQLKDGKALHKNIPLAEGAEALYRMFADEYYSLNIIDVGGVAECLRSKSGNFRFVNKIKQGEGVAQIEENNRRKNYIFPEGEKFDFLVLLGISSSDGRVYDKKQSKFRQINRFVEIIADVCDSFGDELTVWDLCCGKSYLTFAAYYYLTYVKNKKVKMTGVDLKADVVGECNAIAEQLGWDGLSFVCSDINAWCGERADLVISLHACDTATDTVLSKAVKCNARVILSSPCCQHEFYSMMDCPELRFITKHSMLKKKLCECATDALRCSLLECYGYKVTTLEFIDPEETPKNMLIRATYKGIGEAEHQRKLDEYLNNCRMLGVEPSMKKMLLD